MIDGSAREGRYCSAPALTMIYLIVPVLLLFPLAGEQTILRTPQATTVASAETERDRGLAARFAPIFHQRLTPDVATHRFDYIARYDFDGDWVGTNNWQHAADAQFPLRAYIYYSVIESETHFFITYAVFHPRDWSLEQPAYEQTLDWLKQKYPTYFPGQARAMAEFNHENDLEGMMVVARKVDGPAGARLEAVETVAHDRFYKHLPAGSRVSSRVRPEETIQTEGDRPIVYIESQKHGIRRYVAQARRGGPVLIYRYTGSADEPKPFSGPYAFAPARQELGYDLLPIYDTLWIRARNTREPNDTFGEIYDFGSIVTAVAGLLSQENRQTEFPLGPMGVALRGEFAAKNKARLPWGWYDRSERQLKLGEWFLDPAKAFVAHFPRVAGVSQRYVSNPFLGIWREGAR